MTRWFFTHRYFIMGGMGMSSYNPNTVAYSIVSTTIQWPTIATMEFAVYIIRGFSGTNHIFAPSSFWPELLVLLAYDAIATLVQYYSFMYASLLVHRLWCWYVRSIAIISANVLWLLLSPVSWFLIDVYFGDPLLLWFPECPIYRLSKRFYGYRKTIRSTLFI